MHFEYMFCVSSHDRSNWVASHICPHNIKRPQASKYLKIGTCPASQNFLAYMRKILNILEISKFSLALQPEALVNTSGRVLFSRPGPISVKI